MTSTSTSSGTSTGTSTHTEAEIRAVLDQHAAAHAARDAEAIVAAYADGAVRYALAPPLQQGPGTMVGDVQGVRAWLATFDGPVRIEHRDLVVTADGSVAFASALTRMTATPAGAAEPFSFWFRSTFGLRRVDGWWRIVHEHESTPFHMDGSFRAATDLQP
jgi:ketosteroid isomerase-like protein